MSRLDQMLERARTLEVRDESARRFVAELARWAGQDERRRVPWRWFGGGLALATASAVVLLLATMRTGREVERSPIRLGDRVAIIAGPSTHYRIVAADENQTIVEVERGTITARLWHGARPYRLALRGGGVEAVATGTVFALRVDDGDATVEVHEGKVAVSRGDDHVEVAAGTAWPRQGALRSSRDAARLLAMPGAPAIDEPAAPPELDAGVADASREDADAAVAAVEPPPRRDAAAVVPPRERWRRARLLRGQGKFDEALAECLAIADAKDATWSPIALVEAARIELGPKASPERAIEAAERFIAEWPHHALAPEARDIRCRALRQLGRSAECTAP